MLIIVDCGMTNMRCRLVDGGRIISEVKKRSLVSEKEDPRLPLIGILSDATEELLLSNGLKKSDVEAIVCSGILSSDVGIHRVPHVMMPAGISESAGHAEAVRLPEYPDLPILFIPGVRTSPDRSGNEVGFIAGLDSMSGEECETYGIMKLCGLTGDFTLALPGTYNKTLYIDKDGRITVMQTGMCGEFMAAISGHTILRHALPSPLVGEINEKMLFLGFDLAGQLGTSPAMIKARNAMVWGGYTKEECGNLFVGAALHDDIVGAAKTSRPDHPFYIGGSDPLRHIFALLLARTETGAKELDDGITSVCSAVGAEAVFGEYTRLHGGINI